jgi:dipeptidyl aminopeptidase/acylaminoacyl peptidase
MARRKLMLSLLLALLLAGCATPTPVVIPTVVMLNTVPPEQAATQTAAAYLTQVSPPTLPPTWTPVPTPTPEVLAALPEDTTTTAPDRLLYVADGILAAVNTDGTEPRALTGPSGVRDLALSPDGTQLAFVAQGAGSAYEVYILDLLTGQQRPVTALGFAEMHDPAWHPNGQLLAFAAGQYAGQAREIYTVRPDGQGIQQRTVLARSVVEGTPTGDGSDAALFSVDATLVSSPVFTLDGASIIFAAPGLNKLDLSTDAIEVLAIYSGFGSDTNVRWRPGTDDLIYIRPTSSAAGYMGGPLHEIDMENFVPNTVPPMIADVFAQGFACSADGRRVVIAADFSLYLFDYSSRSVRKLLDTGSILPQAAINPDGSQIAYIGGSISGGDVPQMIITDATGRNPRVVMDVPAQTLDELLWIPGA